VDEQQTRTEPDAPITESICILGYD